MSLELALTCIHQALSRVPPLEQYDRVYRMRRAVQCSILQRDLPKDQWTTPENVRVIIGDLLTKQDKRYVTPLLKEVQAADDERLAWDTMKVEQLKHH